MKKIVGNGKICIVLLSVILFMGFLGCNKNSDRPISTEPGAYEVLEIRYQGYTDEVRPHELAEDLGYLEPLKLKWIGNVQGGPQDLQMTQTNEVDIGGAFMTAVINLKAANGTLIGVIGSLGSDATRSSSLVVLEDSPIRSPRDFIGKTFGVNTLAAASEAYIKNYLVKGGLTPAEIDKVELVVIPPVSMAQALRSKQIDGAQISGIIKDKSLESGGLRIVFSDIDIFGDNTNNLYAVRKEFAEQNPNSTRKLVEAMAKAIEWSKETPIEEVRARMKDIIKKRNRDEEVTTVDYFKGFGLASKGGLVYDKDLQIWIDWLVSQDDLKEGQLKPTDIYTNEFNPYNDVLNK
ncbi:ABC transporter substrate-binding protein [Treponema primitia]|uniref:ABC transporter substrate-binding protein n=1 Tax=Treponema primitia TaxID=88058 RepID=UPI00398103DA